MHRTSTDHDFRTAPQCDQKSPRASLWHRRRDLSIASRREPCTLQNKLSWAARGARLRIGVDTQLGAAGLGATCVRAPRRVARPSAIGYMKMHAAPVAQLDRALPSEGRGHRFESCRARHSSTELCGSRGRRTGCPQIRRGTGLVMSGIVESVRESGHGDIDANDPIRTSPPFLFCTTWFWRPAHNDRFSPSI